MGFDDLDNLASRYGITLPKSKAESSTTTSTASYTPKSGKAAALKAAAEELGIDAADLGAIISFETGGSFDPHKIGGEGNRYKGLIQFGPTEQRQYYRPNDTFESQVRHGVVNYFKDRFSSVGRDTRGASLEDLYTTVIAGNPNANRNARDSFGTSAKSGAQKIAKDHRPKVLQNFFRSSADNATSIANVPLSLPDVDFEALQDRYGLNNTTEDNLDARYGIENGVPAGSRPTPTNPVVMPSQLGPSGQKPLQSPGQPLAADVPQPQPTMPPPAPMPPKVAVVGDRLGVVTPTPTFPTRQPSQLGVQPQQQQQPQRPAVPLDNPAQRDQVMASALPGEQPTDTMLRLEREPVEALYQDFLKQTGLPDNEQSVKEFNLGQKASVDLANEQNQLAYAQDRAAIDKYNAGTAAQRRSQSARQSSSLATRMDTPLSLPEDDTGGLPLIDTDVTNKTEDQILDEIAGKIASHINPDKPHHQAVKAYLKKAGIRFADDNNPVTKDYFAALAKERKPLQTRITGDDLAQITAAVQQYATNEDKLATARQRVASENPDIADNRPERLEIMAAEDAGLLTRKKAGELLMQEHNDYIDWLIAKGYGDEPSVKKAFGISDNRPVSSFDWALANNPLATLFGVGSPNTRRIEEDIRKDMLADLQQYGSLATANKALALQAKNKAFSKGIGQSSEAVKAFPQYLAKLLSTALEVGAIGADANPIDIGYEAVTGNPSGIPQQLLSAAEEWRNMVDRDPALGRNPAYNKDTLVKLADVTAQLATQVITAPLTGGLSLGLPLAEGGTAAYRDVAKNGASRGTRLMGAGVGSALAVPELLLRAKYLSGVFKSMSATETFTGRMASQLVKTLAPVFGKEEARQITQATIGSFIKSAAKNSVVNVPLEHQQERWEDVGNKLFKKIAVDSRVTWEDVFLPTAEEQTNYALAGIAGLGGAAVETTVAQMSDFELQKGKTDLANLLADKRISATEYKRGMAARQDEITARQKRGEYFAKDAEIRLGRVESQGVFEPPVKDVPAPQGKAELEADIKASSAEVQKADEALSQPSAQVEPPITEQVRDKAKSPVAERPDGKAKTPAAPKPLSKVEKAGDRVYNELDFEDEVVDEPVKATSPKDNPASREVTDEEVNTALAKLPVTKQGTKFAVKGLWSGRTFESKEEAQDAIRKWAKSRRMVADWREYVAKSEDDTGIEQAKMLRRVAEKGDDQQAREILDQAKALPWSSETSQVYWEIAKNPRYSDEIKTEARKLHDRHFDLAPSETPKPSAPVTDLTNASGKTLGSIFNKIGKINDDGSVIINPDVTPDKVAAVGNKISFSWLRDMSNAEYERINPQIQPIQDAIKAHLSPEAAAKREKPQTVADVSVLPESQQVSPTAEPTATEARQNRRRAKNRGEAKAAAEKPSSDDGKKEEPANKSFASDENFQDWGEKIGGAKKDLVRELSDISDADLTSQPLSKIFPRPNFAKLIAEKAITLDGAKILSFLYDNIPAKPRKAWKVKSWVEQASQAITIYKDVLGPKPDAAQLFLDLARKSKISPLADAFDIYSVWLDVTGFPEKSASMQGYEIKLWRAGVYGNDTASDEYLIVQGGLIRGKYESAESAAKALQQRLEQPKKVVFNIYQDRLKEKNFFVGKKGAKGVVRLVQGFEDIKAARTFLEENQTQLEAMWEGRKYQLGVERKDATEEVRESKDWRNGKDIASTKEFGSAFGFKGVEFGNWVKQGATKNERQQAINDAYDALMDLSDLIGVPPRAMSLNGTLSLALGARGSGKASAHYEPTKIVINLTKTRGKGSLAHEWWHALDNYFSRNRGEKDKFVTEFPNVLRNKRSGEIFVDDTSLRTELLDGYRGVVDAIKKSGLPGRSSNMDATRTERYWSTMVEMTARSFENYVIEKLAEDGRRNDYLANFRDMGDWAKTFDIDAFPYPLKDESPALNAAFDNLFEVMESEETDDGNVLLKSIPRDQFTVDTIPFITKPMHLAHRIKVEYENAETGEKLTKTVTVDKRQQQLAKKYDTVEALYKCMRKNG